MVKSYLFFLFIFIGLFLLYKYSSNISQLSYLENIIKSFVVLVGIFTIIFPYLKTNFPKSFTKKNIKKFMLKKYKCPN